MIAIIPQILGLATGLLRTVGSWQVASATTKAAKQGLSMANLMTQHGPLSKQLLGGYAKQNVANITQQASDATTGAFRRLTAGIEDTYGAVQKVNTGLDRFGGTIASSNIRLEQSRYQRGMQFAAATGATYSEYTKSVIEKEKAGAQMSADLQNLSNGILTVGNKILTVIYDIYNWFRGSEDAPEQVPPWRQFVGDAARMK